MSNTTRQFQGCTAERQDVPFGVLRGAGSFDDPQGVDPAANDAPMTRRTPLAAPDASAPVSNLLISSWYAISGTAMS